MASELTQLQIARGGLFVDYYGAEVVSSFGDPQGEYEAVTGTVGLLDLSWRSIVSFTGPDAAQFLHSLTTNDVLHLEPGEAQHTANCNISGHLVGVFRLTRRGDTFWADMHPSCAAPVLQNLDKHLIMEEVEISLQPPWGILSLQGPAAAAALEKLGVSASEMTALHGMEWTFGDHPAFILPDSHTGEPGFDIFVSVEGLRSLWETLSEIVRALGGRPVGMDALRTLRVEAGIPWWGEDLDSSMLMLEAGLEDSIHWSKGCYLGQETLARIHFRGHTNRQMQCLLLKGPELPARGTPLLSGEKEAGFVTTAVDSPKLGQPIALGMVRREFLEPGTILRVDGDGGPAEVCGAGFGGG